MNRSLSRHGTTRERTLPIRLMSRVVLTLMVGIGLVAAACAGSDEGGGSAENPIRLLAVEEFEAFVDGNPDTPLINVHIPYEGHITDTDEFVAFDQILEWDGLAEDLSAPIVLYCRSGNMSGQAARALAEVGYTNIVDLEGGMNAWAASGRALESNPPVGAG